METTLISLSTIACLATISAAIFAFLAWRRSRTSLIGGMLTLEQVSPLLRSETDRIRQFGEDNARGLRQELSDILRGLENGLDQKIKAMGEEANQNRETLRLTIETRLDTAIERQGTAAKEFRDEINNSFSRLGSNVAETLGQISNQQKERLDNVAQSVTGLIEKQERAQEALRLTIENQLNSAVEKQTSAAKEFRDEISSSFSRLGGNVAETLERINDQQKERLDNATQSVNGLLEKQERAQEILKQTVEGRLDAIRGENSSKLEEMRKTVDEKLQSTLEARLGESFSRVVEHLERVHKGIGEMQALATSVGDLKKVFSNVKVRGVIGEIHLEMLLDQYLAADQFVKNAQVKEGTQERVEFAIKLHHHDTQNEWLLPVDVKFPREDYDRLMHAIETNDVEGIADAGKALENQIKSDARTICDKYIAPPRTTDFAILFLPTEGLYSEAMRRPGLFETINRDYGVMLTGPSTFTALLNSLQMGFRAVAIAKRSTEVWKLLGAVQNEFSKYGKVVESLGKQLDTARQSVDKLGVRARVMTRTLRGVDKLPDETAQLLLTSAANDVVNEDDVELIESNLSPNDSGIPAK